LTLIAVVSTLKLEFKYKYLSEIFSKESFFSYHTSILKKNFYKSLLKEFYEFDQRYIEGHKIFAEIYVSNDL